MKCSNKINKLIIPYLWIPILNTFSMRNAFGLLATEDNDTQDCNDNETIQCSNVSSIPSKQYSPTTTVVSIHINQIKPTVIVIPTQHKALQAVCTQNNIHFKRVATENLGRQVHYAISNSGATVHFLVEGAPVVNEKESNQPSHHHVAQRRYNLINAHLQPQHHMVRQP